MIVWTEEMLSLLGKDTDQALAERFGISNTTVARERNELEIPIYEWRASGVRYQSLFKWTPQSIARLGREPDLLIAQSMGISRQAVYIKRKSVSRRAGGMMQRWQTRWTNNVERYEDLSCVKLILPWSTPSMRFCTSELKAAVIASELKKRFKGQEIINVTGIRREESASRKRADVAKVDPRLKQRHAAGITWNPVIDWTIGEVKAAIARRGLELHEAYTRYGMTRVSCVFCIMSSAADLVASTTCPDNHDIYRTMVELEATSTFAFQSKNWLGDVAPHLLGSELADRLAVAKAACRAREMAEARIPVGLKYQDGWPTRRPSASEASIIADVRAEVSQAVGLGCSFLSSDAVMQRYDELLALKAVKTPAVPVEILTNPTRDQLAFGF